MRWLPLAWLLPAHVSANAGFGDREGSAHALADESGSSITPATIRRADVLVLMVDTRNSTHDDLIRRSALVNSLYAYKHGYDFQFAQLVNDGGINGASHDKTCVATASKDSSAPSVWLPAVWCRLLVVLQALLMGYEYVIHLDVDALFTNPPESLPAFLLRNQQFSVAGYGFSPSLFTPAQYDPSSPAFNGSLPLGSAALILPTDVGAYESNCGLQIWRNGPEAKRLLAIWFDLGRSGKFNEFPAEQGVMKSLYHTCR
jgi:hypothetical protein